MTIFLGSCDSGSDRSLPHTDVRDGQKFVLLPSEVTGVDFKNVLEEGPNTNILVYEYFYNGGGVATADFNGDDLIDLYFTSNMADNALFLNRGNLQFVEVTEESGAVGRPGPWKTGVSAADVNGDGRMDLYICYSGSLPPEKRRNELYFNIGNNEENIPIFVESAAEVGLASEAFSTQSYFLDYDRDGDLDVLLLNHNPRNLPILNEVKTRELLGTDDRLRGVRLYRQDEGYFNDVTNEAGISSSELTYGLGVGITDFNNDGWPDFYVSNDYSVPDYLYINKGNGSFTNDSEDALGHISHFSMGNDVGDVNNDGTTDIITLDMLPEDNRRQKLLLTPDEYPKFDLNVRSGFHHQYMRNMLQLNNGDGTFSEVGQMAGISNTDWSWSVLLADYDNDGYKDLYVTNGYYRDYTNLDFINYMNAFVQEKGRLQREDVLEIIRHMPSSDLSNYMFKGGGGGAFEEVTKEWGMQQPSKSNGAAYADLDNDGDLEMIVNNINQPAFVYNNMSTETGINNFVRVVLKGNGKNTAGIGAKVALFANGSLIIHEQYLSRGYQSSVSPVMHFGIGPHTVIDSLEVVWPSGKTEKMYSIRVNQTITLSEMNASVIESPGPTPEGPFFVEIESTLNYSQRSYEARDFDRQPLLMYELSESGPCMTADDVNKDGRDDLFVGGAMGQPGIIFLWTSSGEFRPVVQPALENDAGHVDSDALFFDANNDGYQDLYVVSGGYHDLNRDDERLADRLYLNDRTGKLIRSDEALPNLYTSGSCVAAADINGDGFEDLFIGGRVVPGRYPEIPESLILINDGTGKFIEMTSEWSPKLQRIGMVTDAEWMDFNGDSVPDLIVAGDWMPIRIFINQGGSLSDQTRQYFRREYNGLWNTLTIADVNRDGISDIIAGNVGKNVQFTATVEEPCELLYSDFDNNGSIDPLFSYYIEGTSYPYVTRDELRRQLAPFAASFPSFESYADATVEDIVGQELMLMADKHQMTHQETSLFMGQADGSFVLQPLPAEVQYAPVYAILPGDFNDDDHTDLLLCGNNSSFKLRLGKADANYGQLLLGNGSGQFEYVPQSKSGLSIKGDVRSLKRFDDRVYFGINQNGILSYRTNASQLQ